MWLCVKMGTTKPQRAKSSYVNYVAMCKNGNHKATKSIKQLCELCGYVLKWKTTKSQSAKSSYVNYVAMC
jgi:rRNA maturation endonuclease Nob1